jgi:hypothetical protein
MLFDARRDYEAEKLRADAAQQKVDELQQHVSEWRQAAAEACGRNDALAKERDFNKSQWVRFEEAFTDETLARSRQTNALQSELAATIKTSEGRLAVLKDKADELYHEWIRAERAEAGRMALVESIWALVRLDTDITNARQRLKEIRALLLAEKT